MNAVYHSSRPNYNTEYLANFVIGLRKPTGTSYGFITFDTLDIRIFASLPNTFDFISCENNLGNAAKFDKKLSEIPVHAFALVIQELLSEMLLPDNDASQINQKQKKGIFAKLFLTRSN